MEGSAGTVPPGPSDSQRFPGGPWLTNAISPLISNVGSTPGMLSVAWTGRISFPASLRSRRRRLHRPLYFALRRYSEALEELPDLEIENVLIHGYLRTDALPIGSATSDPAAPAPKCEVQIV